MVCMSAPPDLLCGALDGAHDPEMRSAAAEITLQRLLDVAVARIGVFVEQRLRGHDHAVDAVAALRGLLVDEGLLARVRLVDRAEPFERRYLAACRPRHRPEADPGDRKSLVYGKSVSL